MSTITNNNFGIYDNSYAKLVAVFKAYQDVEKVLIFGSRAKGNFKEGSDIDLALIGRNLSHSYLSELREIIDDLNMPYSVDLVLYNEKLDIKLREHIDRVGLVFFKK